MPSRTTKKAATAASQTSPTPKRPGSTTVKKPAGAAKPKTPVERGTPKGTSTGATRRSSEKAKPPVRRVRIAPPETVLPRPAQAVLANFARISAIPRPSKQEEAIRRFFCSWADQHGFPCRTDEIGNVLISVPGTARRKQAVPVILQAHLDMVCEKTPDSPHDFTRDGIAFVREGEWLHADRTTLGADNGIGLALAMTVAEDEAVTHPPLELLFTVDEETGLTGARCLRPGFFQGRTLLNLDSEDEGVFTIGCAGGKESRIALPLDYEAVPDHYCAWQVSIKGLTGGHSGVNIHEERANAIRVLVRTLLDLSRGTDLRVISLSGGTAHNAIPRDATATFFLPGSTIENIRERLAEQRDIWQQEFARTDPHLTLAEEPFLHATDNRAMTAACTRRALDLLLAMPHGVTARSTTMPGLVETSNNQAKVWVADGTMHVLSSQRSSVPSRLGAITDRIEAVARLAGAGVESGDGYPPWTPNPDSGLLETCVSLYQDLFQCEPKVEAIHAGLECGLIGNLAEGMDMISLGPTIKDPHSPQERMHVPSLDRLYQFLTALLEKLATR
jgi:dipeptidase D